MHSNEAFGVHLYISSAICGIAAPKIIIVTNNCVSVATVLRLRIWYTFWQNPKVYFLGGPVLGRLWVIRSRKNGCPGQFRVAKHVFGPHSARFGCLCAFSGPCRAYRSFPRASKSPQNRYMIAKSNLEYTWAVRF